MTAVSVRPGTSDQAGAPPRSGPDTFYCGDRPQGGVGSTSGYRRAAVRGCGAGAAEVWAAVVDGSSDGAGPPWPVGEVGPVYERSVYLAFDPDAVEGAGLLGPALVLLADGDLDGPLATTIDLPAGRQLPSDRLSPGDPLRLWRTAGSPGARGRRVLGVGDALDLVVDPAGLVTPTEPERRYGDLATFRRGGERWERALAAVDALTAAGAEDGLGWLPHLARLEGGRLPAGDLRSLADGWAAVVVEDGPTPCPPPSDVLGRGPGATPSGDDLLAGLMLALRRTTPNERRARVVLAGERVVTRATERTTTVSAALLAQAVRGRTTPRIEAGLRGLLAPDVPRSKWEPAVLEAAEAGHTSGVDTLIGALLVPLAVGPRVETAD